MPDPAAHSELLFAYGTLQLEAVQLATFGRRLDGTSDALAGFELAPLQIADQAVIAISGSAQHTMARFTGRASDVVPGTVFVVTPEEIRNADSYEVADVKRVAVVLQSGLRAWAYIGEASPHSIHGVIMKRRALLPLTAALVLGVTPLCAQGPRPESEQALARAIYKEFIEIQSGFTTGSTTPVAQAAAARLKAAGFPDADVHVDGPNPRKANLVVRYHGSGARKPLLLLAHTDVVEAKREDWTMDPFQLIEKDGYFYGRGTGDDKAQAAVWIAILIQYKKEGFTPDRDIIVALTADEEGGGPFNGVDWLIKNHRDWIDADYALNEGGWGESINGKRVANDLQVSEKYVVNFRLEVRNKGGHSSLPVADNAIYHLAGALDRLSRFAFPLKTNEVTAAYFKQIAKTEAGAVKADLEQVAAGSHEAMQRVAKASTAWNATLRTTCIATMLEGGHALNALPQLAAATVNCRVLPDDAVGYVHEALRKVVADTQVAVAIMGSPAPGPASPLRKDVMGAVTSATEKMWPGVITVPIMVMGATDGRSLRAAGIPTYGIQGFFFDRDDIRFHGRDERMRVQSFYEGHAFLYDLVKRLSRATPAS